jgi:hypothetical protein
MNDKLYSVIRRQLMRKTNQILILITIILFSMTGCKSEKLSTSTPIDLSENFDTMSDLKQGATNIVEVEVLDNYVIVQGDMPFTISNLKVLSTIKGDIMKGDKIKVLETGGKFTSSGVSLKGIKGQEVDMKFGGISVMQTGEHLILFIRPFVGPQVTDAYVPLGVWQGKFKVGKGNNGKVEQQAPVEYKLKDYKPVNLGEFINDLEN